MNNIHLPLLIRGCVSDFVLRNYFYYIACEPVEGNELHKKMR